MKYLFIFVFTIAYFTLLPTSASYAQSSCNINFPGPTPACRDYIGSNWTSALARADCNEILGAPQPGTLIVGEVCTGDGVQGSCRVDGDTANETLLSFYDGDLVTLETFCVDALSGVWTEPVVGSCDYEQVIPGAPNQDPIPTCRAYTGNGWLATNAEDNCSSLNASTFKLAASCAPPLLGQCILAESATDEIVENYSAGNPDALEAGCGFSGGVWVRAQAPDDPVMPQAVEALQSDDKVLVTPDGCDQACSAELATTGDWIEFIPQTTELRGGIIFYGGEDVDPRAYAVFARSVAEAGYFVAIPTFIGNISILDPFRANEIIAAHPEVPAWGMVGHSLGGVSASVYADVDPLNVIEGVVMLAGFASNQLGAESDLSDNDLRVYMLRGDRDGLINLTEFNDGITRTPANTVVEVLRGGNHAQFGYYGQQAGDMNAEMTREQQHELAVGVTLHMASHFGLDPSTDFIDPDYRKLKIDSALCARTQRRLAGFERTDLLPRDIVLTQLDTFEAIQFFQAGFDTGDKDGLINVGGLVRQLANSSDITAPAILEGEHMCKMKSQEAIVAEYGFTPRQPQAECANINQQVFRRALFNINLRDLLAYLLSGTEIQFAPDLEATNGIEWIATPYSLNQVADGNFELKASRLRTPVFIPGVPAEFLGVNYCRVWSLESAVQFLKANGIQD